MTIKKAFQNMIALDAVCGQKDFYDEEFRQTILMAERSFQAWEKVKEEIEETNFTELLNLSGSVEIIKIGVLNTIKNNLKEVSK